MRNLLVILIVLAAGFVIVGMYVAPDRPELRDWYGTNACPTLDRISPKICEPIRRAGGAEKV